MSTPAPTSPRYEFVIRRTFWFPMIKIILWNMAIFVMNIAIIYGGQWMNIDIPGERLHLFFHFTGLIGTMWIFLRWHSIKYTITNKKIVIEKGILNIDRDTFLFRNIECVKLHKNILGRLCWFGTIAMYAPTLQERIFLRNVSNAKKFFLLIQRSIAEHRQPQQIIYPSKLQQETRMAMSA